MIFRLSRRLGTKTREIADFLKTEHRVQNKETRVALADYILSLHSHRWWGMIAVLLLMVVLLAVIVWQPVTHAMRKDIPVDLTFKDIRSFDPTKEKATLEKAPFLNALRGSLTTEGGEEKFKIVLFETQPFVHPTPRFTLTLKAAEKTWFDVTGYAFRVRHDSRNPAYEPLGADLSEDGVVKLDVPESEAGDYISGILRITLKEKRPFPDNLKEQIKAHTPKTPEGK
jgi:hypothetical protein